MGIHKIVKNPGMYLIMAIGRVLPDTVSADRFYLKLLYKNRMKKKLNLDPPTTYNEKLQWMKLYNRNPDYTMMVDKYEVKDYVARCIGKKYIIPTLGVWNQFEDIDFDKLPDQFVLKCTHDSGGLIICKDKSKLDVERAKKKIIHALKRKYYLNTREWPYKNVKPRIIAEMYLEDPAESSGEIADYKIHCFNGEPKFVLVCTDRNAKSGLKEDFFDIEWNHLDIRRPKHPNAEIEHSKPDKLQEMLDLAKKLAEGMPFGRIDFYEIDGKVYFGEITFFPASGFSSFVPDEWDYKMGSWITLS